MRQVLTLDALEFRVVVRRILRPVQQYQLKRFEIHASLSQDTVSGRLARQAIRLGHPPATIRSCSIRAMSLPYDGAVCTDDSPASMAAAVRHDVEPAIEIDLEPVDSVTVVILMDNVTDALMADHGPARRADPGRSTWRPLAVMD